MASQKALSGAATALNGQEVRMLRLWSIMSTTSIISPLKSLGKINWSSEVISPFLEDWEVGRVASSCHLSMDLFVPRNETCVQGELRV